MSKKVLILGCQGTLGQALVEEFSGSGYAVTAWDKDDTDVTSPQISQQVATARPDILINAIGYNAVDKAETDPEQEKLAYLLNAEVPGKLAKIAKELDAAYVHYSTNYVFSGEKPEGYSEADPAQPVNKYGRSKLEGEKLVSQIGGNYYIIRLSRLFGVRGVSPVSKRTFVDIMLAEVDKPELEVGNTEVGNPTYAPDLARYTRELIEAGQPAGVYHGANSGFCTWYEWAVEIFKDLGHGPKVTPASHSLTPKASRHPVYAGLVSTKFKPLRSWQEALKEFLQNF